MAKKSRYEYRSDIDFPCKNLLEVNQLDLETQEKCLKRLQKMSKRPSFYENLTDLENLMDFFYMNLISINDQNYSETVVFSQLEVLNHIVKKLDPESLNVIVDTRNIFKIIERLTSLKSVSKISTSLILQILLEILNPLEDISGNEAICALLSVRKKLQELRAENDLAILCGFVFQKLPNENCGVFIWSVHWLISHAVDILSRDRKNAESSQLKATIVQIISELWQVFQKPLPAQGPPGPLRRKWQKFVEKLTNIAEKVVELCTWNKTTELHAKQVLGVILQDFMKNQEILTQQTWTLVLKDLPNLPRRRTRWPSVKYLTFFWICHLVLDNNGRCLWNQKQIFDVICELILSRDRSVLSPEILKSICFIYPTLSARSLPWANSLVHYTGEIILSYLQFSSGVLVSRILSFDVNQLAWILSSAQDQVKEDTLRWWLLRSDTVLTEVKKLIKTLDIESLILNILVKNEENSETDKAISARCVDLIQEFNNPEIYKEIEFHLLDCIEDYQLFSKLIKTRPKVPDEEYSGSILVKTAFWVLPRCSDIDTFQETCRFIRYIIKEFSRTLDFVSDSETFFFIKLKEFKEYPKVSEEIVKLTKVLIQWQAKMNKHVKPTLIFYLMPLLRDAKRRTVRLCLDLLHEIATSHGFSVLESGEGVLDLANAFMDLSGNPTCCSKSGACLAELVMAHDWLIEHSLFRNFLEQRCFFLGKSVSLSFLKLLFLWIKLMQQRKRRANVILPNKNIVESYIRKCRLKSHKVQLYLILLRNIYKNE